MVPSIRRCKTWVAVLLLQFAALEGCNLLAEKTADSPALRRAPVSAAVFSGWITQPEITEASGMAPSRRRTDLLWIANDGGNGEFLYAVGLDGSDLGKVRVENATNVDWEDLASFRHNGDAFLLIGDFGDNRGQRKTKTLYVVREPHLKGPRFEAGMSVAWNRRIRFVFADGPRDCEGLGVDTRRARILLLTKRTRPPLVYELPLPPGDGEEAVRIAQRSARIVHIPPPSAADLSQDPLYGRFRSQPTAVDISGDGRLAAVLTYGNGYLYERLPQESWSDAFRRPPRLIPMPKLRQAEALCFNARGDSLYLTSEKRPTPLYRLDLIP